MPRRAVWLAVGLMLASVACSTSKRDDATQASTVPPATQAAGQAAVCSMISEDALVAAGIPAGTVGVVDDDPQSATLAGTTTCLWNGTPGVSAALFTGGNPSEILALARQSNPGGTDVTGIGTDAYLFEHVIFVNTGSQVFAVAGASTQDQLQALARDVITNL